MHARLHSFIEWWRSVAPDERSVEGWLSKLFQCPSQPTDQSFPKLGIGTQPESTWCVVANVVPERPYGPSGKQHRSGTKHFAGGAKVYVFNTFWGSPELVVTVVGRHRKTKRYMTLHMRSAHLENWRVQQVFSPFILRQICASGWFADPEECSDIKKERARSMAAFFGQASQPIPSP